MKTGCLSPQDFLATLKLTEAQPFLDQQTSPEFLKIHAEQQKLLGSEGINPEKFFDEYFANLLKVIASVMPETVKSEIKRRIAVGCVNNAEVNAFIVRSDDGEHFAIVFNRGLITIMNHFAKLVAAGANPTSVVYCNGMDPQKLSRADYVQISTRMLKGYSQTGKPIGPDLKLAVHSDAMTFVENALTAMHLFVLAHEVGHYLNGDLGSLKNFAKCPGIDAGLVFSQNISHAMEFKADKTAFDIVLKVISAEQPNYLARRALDLAVTMFFNFDREIFNKDTETHPRSSDRLLAVTREFFGDHAAGVMERSFDDTSQIKVFQDIVGKQTVTEILNRRKASI